MKDARIAVVQLDNTHDVDLNYRKMRSYIDNADGVDIICFPEACLTGYSTNDTLSLSRDDDHVKGILALACEKDIVIIFGFVEKDNDRMYVTQVVAADEVMFYRKTHLGVRERSVFSEGDELPVIETKKAKIGLQLCWESHIPDITTVLRRKGAEIVFMPHSMRGPVLRRKETWMKCMPARAYDNGIYVCAVNDVQGDGTGGMMVFDRFGNVIYEDISGKETMSIIDLKALPEPEAYPKDMKEASYFLRRRPELYDR